MAAVDIGQQAVVQLVCKPRERDVLSRLGTAGDSYGSCWQLLTAVDSYDSYDSYDSWGQLVALLTVVDSYGSW